MTHNVEITDGNSDKVAALLPVGSITSAPKHLGIDG